MLYHVAEMVVNLLHFREETSSSKTDLF